MYIRWMPTREAPDGGGGGGDGKDPPDPKPGAKTYDEAYVSGLRREAQTYRERLTAVEAEFKTFRETAASELKKATDAADAAQTKANDALRDSALRMAAKEAGMVDLDALKLFDVSAVQVGEDGNVEIPEKFFEDAKKSKGYLFEKTGADTGTTSSTSKAPAQPGGASAASGTKAPHARDMTDAEYAAARAAVVKF